MADELFGLKIDGLTMKILFNCVLVFSLFAPVLGCQQNKSPLTAEKDVQSIVQHLPGSPYPASKIPDTLFVVDEAQFTPDQLLVIETLQGVLAQKQPAIYRRIAGGYARWLSDLEKNFGVTVDHSFETDFDGLLRHFKSKVSGYLLCNPRDASVNVAFSLCGIRNGIAVTPAIQGAVERLGIPLLEDVRGKDVDYLLQNCGDAFSKRIVSYQKPSKSLHLADYAIFGKMITFFTDVKSSLFDRVLRRSGAGGALLGWGDDEFQLVSESSRRGFWVHAADWALNLSTLSNFNADLKQKAPVKTQVVSRENVHTVCFLMSDGDNVQWLLNDFSTNAHWYGSPLRGQLNLGWGVSPAMCELAPTVLSLFYREAANSSRGRDYFIASSSGLGYIYPERFKNLSNFVALTAAFMKKADLHIVNIIGNNRSEAALAPYLNRKEIDAIFYYDFTNYSSGHGAIDWINGKPVICGRYNLWKGFETPLSLAEKLNQLPRDVHSPQGYSLIPVHVWSNGVEQVLDCVHHLNNNVQVVTPDVFVNRIVKYLKSESAP